MQARTMDLPPIRIEKVEKSKAALVTRFGIVLYVIVSILYLGFGQANADEGWYLYASQLVLHGSLPYRDFAYTQMPLLPYLYGLVQVLQPSLFLGRLTSILFSIGTLGMCVVIARRYGGLRAAGLTALLLACFTFGVYYNSIVKTYALVSFFFTATLFVLSSDLNDNFKYPLALLYACAAVLVRVTAIFFAVPILLYVLMVARRKVRALVVMESAASTLVAGFFLLPDWPAARWNLFNSHIDHWGTAPAWDQFKDILTQRLPDIAQNFGPLLVLAAATFYFVLARRDVKVWRRDPSPLWVSMIGLGLFAVSHLANGLWETEYLVPAMVALIPILGIALSRVYADAEQASRTFIQAVFVAVLFLMPLVEGTQHTDLTGGRLPLTEIDQVASFVAANSQPNDKVLALEALDVAIDAHRQVLPDLTLAQFSLQDLETARALELHVVNNQLVKDAIIRKDARVIVLTDADLYNLTHDDPPGSVNVQPALDQNYRQALVMSDFGQYSRKLFVYTSR